MKLPPQSSVGSDLRLVREALQGGDIRSATLRVDQLLRSHPARADAKLAKAIVLLAQGDQPRALGWLLSSLQTEPRNPEALMWAAVTSLNLARFPEAEDLARRFKQAQPNNYLAYSLHAGALRGLGRIKEALSEVEHALKLKPDDPNVLVTKARLLKSSHLPNQAIDLYRRVLTLSPFLPAATDLSEILLKDSHADEALSLLTEVSAGLPEGDRPHSLIARAHTELQQFEEADRQWTLAEKFSRDRSEVVVSRAKAEIAVGRFHEAEVRLEEAIEAGIRPSSCFAVLTTGRKMSAGDIPLVERMEGILASGEVRDWFAAELNYALGKSWDDLGDYERAIGYFDEANRLSYELSPHRKNFSREAGAGFNDFLMRHFTKERIRALAEYGLESELPLFVVGMMRSGTTLSEHILSSHSRVKAAGEQSFWTEREPEYLSGRAGTFDAAAAARLGRRYLEMIDPKRDNIRYVVDKNPSNVFLTVVLHTVFPNAKFVHVQRHPVDNLLSIWMTPISEDVVFTCNRENLVFMYRSYLRLLAHMQEVLPPDRFQTFKYEDITSNPTETIGAMLKHLELEPEPACFAPEKNPRTVLTPSVYQVRQPIHKGSQERWKRYERWLGPFAELLDVAEA